MFCPRCGQKRTSHATSFCSRCGFLLTGVSDLLQTGGIQSKDEGESDRSRGVRIGIFMLLLLIVVAPILGILSVFIFRIPPWPMGIAIFLMGGGGILRIAYALMFESNSKTRLPRESKSDEPNDDPRTLETATAAGSLPPQMESPASTYSPPTAGKWLDTNELEPARVTEHTTKLLEKDQ